MLETEKEARKRKAQTTRIYKKTIEYMQSLSIWRVEFDPSVHRYAQMRMDYDFLHEKWYQKGGEIEEKYTNKSGATNSRKTNLYMALERLRKDLNEMETLLGLNPRGLKAIRSNGLDAKKESGLEKLLMDDG